ncbi:MAG: methyltransferase domain-containing protein [Phycisphaerales bacterium]|nr:methyltransferase domain-containing protein [Phycisphaerales bacterium]
MGRGIVRHSTLMVADEQSVAPIPSDGAENKPHDAVRSHFKNASTEWGSRYEKGPTRMSDLDLQLRRENVHRLLRPIVVSAAEPLRVIDVGCGSGDVLDGFPRDSIVVTGVDLVPEMVAAAARSHAADHFVAGDAQCLPFAPGEADVAICLGALEYVSDPAAALRSIYRSLRSGGRLIVSFPNRRSLFRKLSVLEIWCEHWLIRTRNRILGRTSDGVWRPSYRHVQWSFRGIRRLLAAAGFEIEEVRFNTYGLWGHIGRWPVCLNVSRQLSRRWGRPGILSTTLACTIVLSARRD